MISIPKQFYDAQNKITRILKSPLLPKECSLKLEKIMERCFENIEILRKTLEESAQQLMERYPDLETMKKASVTWISNKYNHNFKSLEELALDISDYLRDYLKIDSLFNM